MSHDFRLAIVTSTVAIIASATVAGNATAAPTTPPVTTTPAPNSGPVAAPAPRPAAPAPAPAAVKPAAKPEEKSTAVKLDVRRETLDNGLHVIMSVDHTTPTIAVDVVYDVGSRNEERGRAGFAHLFEHMMFQGSKNVARGEHFKLVSAHGGAMNGTTNEDRTNYFEMLPAGELPLALWLESDRMRSLDVSQSNLDNQRQVVEEEYRMRVLNAAYVPSYIRLSELVFQGYWPYEHAAIGTMPDLEAAQLTWVRAFHDAYYAPNNAVLAISGDIDADNTLMLVKRFFGGIAKQPAVPKYDPPPMPAQTAPRNAVMEDEHAKLAAVIDAWPIPPARDKDHYALELASMVLTDGESSRLYKDLVRERSVAADVSSGTDDHRGPDMFTLTARVAGKAKPDDVHRLLLAEVDRLGKAGPTDAELAKVKSRIKTQFLMGLQSNIARAQRLAEFELYHGNAELLNSELDKYLAVTGADIKKAVATYLVTAKSTHIDVKPATEKPATEKPAEKKP